MHVTGKRTGSLEDRHIGRLWRRIVGRAEDILVPDEETGLVAAGRALHKIGLSSERVVRSDHFGLFAERNRISEMAVYVVHASLLLIFLGAIVDALWGWRGELNLTRGQQSGRVQLHDGSQRALPFEVPARVRARRITRTARPRNGGPS